MKINKNYIIGAISFAIIFMAFLLLCFLVPSSNQEIIIAVSFMVASFILFLVFLMLIIKEYKKLNQKKDIDWESISYVLFLDYSTDGAASKKLFKFKVVYKNEKSEIITAKENSFNCDKLLSLIKPIKQPNAAEKLAKYKKMFENDEMSEYEYNLRTSQILVDVEDEKKNALRLYEKSVLKVINWYVKNLSSNEKVIKIIESYVSSHKMPSWKLEFASLPLKVYDNGLSFEIETWIKYLEIESDYIDFVKKVNNDILNKYKNDVKAALIFRNDIYIEGYDYEYNKTLKSQYQETYDLFKSIYDLYILLETQHIIEFKDSKLRYYAFLYLLKREENKKYYNYAISNLEYYGINTDAEDKEIIKKLYDNDMDEEQIATVLWGLTNGKNNFNSLLCDSYFEIELDVEFYIKELDDKNKLKNLLDGKKKNKLYDIEDVDLISGEEFEHFVADLFNLLGYRASTTKLSGDQGIDVLAKKGKTTIAIQTKCYRDSVGNHAIMEAVAGAKYYKADKIMVVTNSFFTKSAKELAQVNGVILWDRDTLKEKMEQI